MGAAATASRRIRADRGVSIHPEQRTMPKTFHGIHPLIFLLIATILEVSGDAVV
jgi:hypothetical protein